MKVFKVGASVLLLVIVMASLVLAQGGTTTTNIQVQNLSSKAAHCTITYYNKDGTVALSYDFTIDPNGTWAKYQGSETKLPEGFDGSVVVSADQPIAAIVNQATTGSVNRSSSYSGESAGATGVYVPIAMKSFYGFETELSIQNASGGNVDVTISYYDSTGTLVAGANDTCTSLAPGAVCRVNQGKNGTLPINFNGSAYVNATGAVVVVANQNGVNSSTSADQQNSFNGFASGAKTVYIPSVMDAFYGFTTAIQVQNIGSNAADITITYSDGIVKTAKGVQPKQSTFFYLWTEGHAARFNGSATVTSSEDIVAIANVSDGAQSSAYNGFGGGGTQFVLPSVLKDFYEYSSSITIQNVSGGNVDCAVTYDDGKPAIAAIGTLTGMKPGESAVLVNRNESHASKYQGSATVVCTGDVVAIVNQGPDPNYASKYTGFDASVAYNGMTP